ncbi:MAG TPA: glycosyltransferase family 2 protein, partial [Candidatus Limnocylindria bacterium]|nr:glycosyltransferase family 2 protein [Candidatus Limnocylindria bacterium]
MKTIFIGIPAYNEAQNILKLLESIMAQKQDAFEVTEIIVICDGCTDNTADLVRNFTQKHLKIKLVDERQRLGQAQRLNQLYKMASQDIFITFDADIILADTGVITKLVEGFNEPKVGLVGGNNIAFAQKNWVEKMAAVWDELWYQI